MIKNQTLVQEGGLRPKSENTFPHYLGSIWAKGDFWMTHILVLGTKVQLQKVRKMARGGIFPIVFIVTIIVWERNKGLVATNKLKTMRRHPGISPEGGRRCWCSRERPNSGPERCLLSATSAHKLLCWYLDEPCPPKIPISTFLWDKTGPLSPESWPSLF